MSKARHVRAVIHWVDEEKVSIEDLRRITNEEDRYVGATTVIKSGSKSYKAIVRLISSDDDRLTACEDAVAQEIEERLRVKQQQAEDKKGRSMRRKKVGSPSAASSRQLAIALGEKPKPAPEHAEHVRERSKSRKNLKNAQEEAQNEIDVNVMGAGTVRKALFQEDENSIMVADVEGVGDDSDSEADDGLVSGGEAEENKDLDDKDSDGESDSDDKDENQNTTSPGTKGCCIHCRELYSCGKGSAAKFFESVQQFLNPDDSSSKIKQYIELKPVDADIPTVELTKGTGVLISAADKNMIRFQGGGDPSKMVRLGLIALYGRERLESEDITARGTRKGSKAVQDSVRKALLAFVNRNKAEAYKSLTPATFNRIINRKKDQLKRSGKSPSSSNSKSKKRSSKKVKESSPKKIALSTPKKNVAPLKTTPVKSSPLKHTSQPERPAAKSTSPWKVGNMPNNLQPNQPGNSAHGGMVPSASAPHSNNRWQPTASSSHDGGLERQVNYTPYHGQGFNAPRYDNHATGSQYQGPYPSHHNHPLPYQPQGPPFPAPPTVSSDQVINQPTFGGLISDYMSL